ncbi:MAG: hypothetical protein MUF75_03240 [Bacteroidia bacterium]|jgi:hypothetical protein|nr:hypothetical protein [Bacteroidia bacterium]
MNILNKKINHNVVTFVGVIIIISFVVIYTIYRQNELLKFGRKTVGEIIECTSIPINGECIVTIEFVTEDGKRRKESITLYKEYNCKIGKLLTVEYSTNSDYIKVIEK